MSAAAGKVKKSRAEIRADRRRSLQERAGVGEIAISSVVDAQAAKIANQKAALKASQIAAEKVLAVATQGDGGDGGGTSNPISELEDPTGLFAKMRLRSSSRVIKVERESSDEVESGAAAVNSPGVEISPTAASPGKYAARMRRASNANAAAGRASQRTSFLRQGSSTELGLQIHPDRGAPSEEPMEQDDKPPMQKRNSIKRTSIGGATSGKAEYADRVKRARQENINRRRSLATS